VAGASAAAALTVLDPLDREAAIAILRGATTVDELAAVTAAPVGAILAALTRLEVGGLVVGDRGRYRASDALAGGVLTRRGSPIGAGTDVSAR
jgi:predicted Rossmann fold nucleotide-binding protein DprA/Smf involved in DNA uptake